MPADQNSFAGRVLIIDDDPIAAGAAAHQLASRGFEVGRAGSASEGLSAAKSCTPDIILMDIEMPGMGGIEACETFRRTPGLERIPIMFFSSGAKEQFIARGFRAGARDYLEKPFSSAELLARVTNLAGIARYEKMLRDVAHDLRLRNETLSHELEAARRMQWSLLPASLAPHPSLRCAVFYEPMTGVGGDLYDASQGTNGWVRLLAADVSGHGVFAALLAAFFRMGYQVYSEQEHGPAGVLQSVHRELCRSLENGAYVTAILAWLNPDTGVLRYASAGHVPALVRRVATGAIEELPATGLMIGLIEECDIGEKEIILAPGDALIMITDGIPEALGPEDEMYGIGRVQRLLQGHPAAGPAELLQQLRMDLEQFQTGGFPEDDLTALAVEWRGRTP